MGWDERNLPCFCGKINQKTWNPLKRKDCYFKPGNINTCSRFLIDNKSKFVLWIQQHHDSVISEASLLINELKDRSEFIRSKFILVLSVLDTFTDLWAYFSGIEKESESFVWNDWFGRFIFQATNIRYNNWSEKCWINKVDWTYFYNLRCSLVHFYWVDPKSKIVLLNESPNILLNRLKKDWSYWLDPQVLLLIIIDASKLMLDEMNNRIKSNNLEYLLSLKKLYFMVKERWWNRLEITI